MKLLRKKAKVVEIRHVEKPTGNPLQSQINDLKKSMLCQADLRQKGYIELRRENEGLREKVARLEDDRDTIFEVLKRPVTLFFNSDTFKDDRDPIIKAQDARIAALLER